MTSVRDWLEALAEYDEGMQVVVRVDDRMLPSLDNETELQDVVVLGLDDADLLSVYREGDQLIVFVGER